MNLPGNSVNGNRGNRGRKRPLWSGEEGGASSSEGSARSARFQFGPQSLAAGDRSNANANEADNNNNNNGNGKRTKGDKNPYEEDSDIFDAANLLNDTMATVLALQKEFYDRGGRNSALCAGHGARAGMGIILQHQIYTVLGNRTAVDLELTAMRKENTLRTFRLGTGREDWGIMSTEHYLRVMSSSMGDATNPDESECLKRLARSTEASRMGGANTARSSVSNRGNNSRENDGQRSISAGGSSSCSSTGGSTKCNSQEHIALFARKVLERLVLSNTNAYVSQKQVAMAMREIEEGRKQDATRTVGRNSGGGAAAADAAAADAAAVDAAAAVAGGRRVAGDGGSGVGRSVGAKEHKGIVKWENKDEELDLRSLKRDEEDVLSLTSKLVHAGFLLPRRDTGREAAFWFSMPNLGKVIAAISRGRKDIIGALKRTRYKEMRRAAMESKNPAKTTGLPLSFHIRDLLGLGMIRELETPSGTFLRLPSDAG